MKKIILTAAAVFAFSFANAQDKKESSEGFAKGDVFITGSFGFDSSKWDENDNYKSSNFSIMPRVGYFASENIAIGAGIGYGSMKVTEMEGDDSVKSDMISVEVFGRYYYTPASSFSLFGELSAAYTSIDFDNDKINGFGAGLGLGINYFVSSNWSLEAGLGILSFGSAKGDWDGAESSNNFELSSNLSNISIGVNYKF